MRTAYLFFLLLFSFSCYANPDTDDIDPFEETNNLDILAGDPETLIYRSVNIATGDYIDIQTDLTLPGADPLQLKRFYAITGSE